MTIICTRVKPLRWGGGESCVLLSTCSYLYYQKKVLVVLCFVGGGGSEAAGNALSQTLRENRMNVHIFSLKVVLTVGPSLNR